MQQNLLHDAQNLCCDRAMVARVHDLARALAAEFAAIHGAEPPITDLDFLSKQRAAVRQSALCLSGGGIRSASFSLGVIQALARARLLGQFDYLSTVSGGGFIGSWLSMLIAQKGSVAAAEQELRESGAAPAVAALRDYTDYLTPHAGLLSDDTWAGIVLYMRNVLINWFAFLPVFVLAVLAAIFYRTLLWTVSAYNAVGLVALGIGAAALVLSTWRALPRPAEPSSDRTQSDHAVRYLPAASVWRWIALPMLVWAFLVPMTLARWLRAAIGRHQLRRSHMAAACLRAGDADRLLVRGHGTSSRGRSIGGTSARGSSPRSYPDWCWPSA